MLNNIKICTISHTVRRFISSGSTIYKNYGVRQSKFMIKLMKKSEPKRKWFKDNPPAALDFHSSLLKEKQPSVHAKRRMVVLNKIFMEHITDLMTTNEATSELLERGVEVTSVSISSDYKILNIFWTLEKMDNKNWPTTIEEVLQKNSFILRHELSQMRIISSVPIICFVKDKHVSLAREVENRLALLDFEKDCIEANDETVKLDVNNDDETDHSNDSFQITLPQMKHDVLGLDHQRIMSKIKNTINKSKNHISKKDALGSHSELTTQTLSTCRDNNDISKSKNQKELFNEFLKKRKIEEKRKYRLRNKSLQPNFYRTNNNDDDDDDVDETYYNQDFDNAFTQYDENDEFEK
ncbi:hypothetical protein M0802_005064 [Mischocyttarus mexicanus]|nr:hypothetical protein M0802_005064 [Mischocyttarus mexicanus]